MAVLPDTGKPNAADKSAASPKSNRSEENARDGKDFASLVKEEAPANRHKTSSRRSEVPQEGGKADAPEVEADPDTPEVSDKDLIANVSEHEAPKRKVTIPDLPAPKGETSETPMGPVEVADVKIKPSDVVTAIAAQAPPKGVTLTGQNVEPVAAVRADTSGKTDLIARMPVEATPEVADGEVVGSPPVKTSRPVETIVAASGTTVKPEPQTQAATAKPDIPLEEDIKAVDADGRVIREIEKPSTENPQPRRLAADPVATNGFNPAQARAAFARERGEHSVRDDARQAAAEAVEDAARTAAKPAATPTPTSVSATASVAAQVVPIAQQMKEARLVERAEARTLDLDGGLDSMRFDTQGQSSTTSTQQSFASTLHRAELPRSVMMQLQHAAKNMSDNSVEIALSPQELGRVRLSISTGDAGVTLHVLAERPETMEMMRKHADDLARELMDLGFAQIDLAFGHGKSPDQETGGDQQQGREGGRESIIEIDTPEHESAPIRPAAIGPDGSLDIRI